MRVFMISSAFSPRARWSIWSVSRSEIRLKSSFRFVIRFLPETVHSARDMKAFFLTRSSSVLSRSICRLSTNFSKFSITTSFGLELASLGWLADTDFLEQQFIFIHNLISYVEVRKNEFSDQAHDFY